MTRKELPLSENDLEFLEQMDARLHFSPGKPVYYDIYPDGRMGICLGGKGWGVQEAIADARKLVEKRRSIQ